MNISSSLFRSSSSLACVLAALLASAAEARAQGTGNGLVAEYFNTNNFTGNRVAVDFNQGPITFTWAGAPRAGVNADNFTVRYRGQIEILTQENVTFFTTQDDQSRLYIDGVLVLTNTTVNVEAPITVNGMTVGRHDIMLEVIEFGGGAGINLQWQTPTIAKAPIPATALYSPTAIPAAVTITPNGGICPVNNVQLAPVPAGGTLYYTLNGTDPGTLNPQNNAAAILFSAPFTINSYLRVQARAYTPGPTPLASDLLISADFSPQFPPLTPPGTIVPQLYFREYFSPTGSLVPNFPTLIPRQRGLAPRPTHLVPPMPPRPNNDNTNFSYLFQGYINIPADGLWTFWTTSDDGSRLFIDGNMVVENNFAQGATARSGQIALTTGFHSIAIPFAQGGGGFSMTAEWQGPAGNNPPRELIPDTAFFTEPIVATPAISPNGGTFATSQVVTLTCATPGAIIFYTIDGSSPDPTQSNGSGPTGTTLTLTAGAVVRVLAAAPGMNISAIASASFASPPKPVSATAAGIPTEVIVQFDKPVDDASAGLPGNYSINNGVTVTGAAALTRPGILLGYWKLDDATPASPSTALDSSGNSNAGVVTNGTQDTVNRPFTALVNPAGANGSSLGFNGTTTTVVVNDSASLNVGLASFTAAAWIRTTVPGTTQHIVGKWDAANGGVGWFLDLQGGGALRFRMRDPQGRNFDNTTAAQPITTANTWVHVAVRIDKLLCRVTYFVNGVLVAGPNDCDSNMDNLSNAVTLAIGNSPSLGGAFFNGQIDEVRLYKAALSNNEIAALAAASDHVSSAVRLTTSTMAAGTTFTLTVANVADPSGLANPPAGVTVPFRYFPAGSVVHERFDNIGGGTLITDLSRNAVFPNGPSSGAFPTLLETPTNAADNYGGRVRGYFTATATQPHRFGIATDDGGKFFLSTDEDPANKILLSRCNVWAPVRGYADPDCVQSGPVPLVAGKKYYFEAYFKEGGGGDNLAVAVKIDDGTAILDNTVPMGDPANTVAPPNSLSPYVDPVVFLTQIPGVAVAAGRAVTFTAPAQGTHTGTFTAPQASRYQWQKNGVNIAGAINRTFAIAAAAASDAGTYSVIVSNGINSATSSVATLTIVDDPRVTLTPDAGPVAGGTLVTIQGSHFVAGLTGVTFGGTAATNVVVLNSITLTCITPARPAGAVQVRITGQSDIGTLAAGFTYYDVPTVIPPLVPNAGPLGGRPGIALTGTNLAPGRTTVTFGGTPATNVAVAANGGSLTCDAPAHAAGVVDVVVTTPGGTATAAGAFTYHSAPTLSLPLVPNAGPLTGRPGIVINGANFVVGQTTATFGGTPALNLVVAAGGSSLTCDAPAHAAGAVDVVVTTPGGSATGTGAFIYYPVPTVATPLIPVAGASLTGTAGVTINGTAFAPGLTSVTFGGSPATGVLVAAGGTSLTCDAPAHAAGAVDVVVTTPGGTAVASAAFTYYAPPTLALPLSPNAGPLSGTVGVTINGANFAPGLTTVTVAGAPASSIVVAAGGASLVCDVPAHAAGAVDVVVTTPGGTTTAPGAFTYYDLPTLVSPLAPASGPAQGGTPVLLTGSNFAPGQTIVTFGGAAASSVNVTGGGTLNLTTPGHDAATVNVVVTTPGGSVTLVNGFTFFGPRITSITPTAGPVAGGQTVTLIGSGFDPSATVTFGANPAAIVSITATSVTVTAPPGAAIGPVDVTLTNPGGNFATVTGGYFYVGGPTVTGVVLNQGPITGGQTVTISGSNFAPGLTTVNFGGANASTVVVGAGNSSLTCVTPAHAAGAVTVTVTTFGNQSAGLPSAYAYINPPTISVVLPSRGSTAGGQVVSITGTNFIAGQTSVDFGFGNTAAVVNVLSSSALTCSTPPHAAGVVDVVVTTFGLQSGTRTGGYVYVNPATSVDLSLTKTALPATPILGATVLFTLTVSNLGAVDATGVGVTDLLPPGLTFVSANTATGAYSAATGLWSVGALAQGSSATLLLSARVDVSTPLTNTAEVSTCTQPDLDSSPGNGISGEDDQASATVSAGLSITTPGGALPGTTSGAFYSQPMTVGGGTPVYAWSLGSAAASLPFNLNPATGRISGTAPTVTLPTTYAFTLRVLDSAVPATLVSQDFSIVVNPPDASLPLIQTSPAPPSGMVGVRYAHVFSASGGAPPYVWSVSTGTLPAGLILNPRSGEVGGTPQVAGAPVVFTIQASCPTGASAQPFSVVIDPNPLVLATPSVRDTSVGLVYSQTFRLEGGLGPTFAWSVASGTLPAGLSFAGTGRTATLSGTPSNSGTFNFVIRAADNGQGGLFTTKPYQLQVFPGGAPFQVTTTLLPPGSQDGAYSATLTGLGGLVPYSWSLVSGGFPAGLSLNGSSGTISGTPAAGGLYPLLFQARDAGTSAGTLQTVLALAPALVLTSDFLLPPTVIGEATPRGLSVMGGTPPYSWSITGGGLPPGLSLSSVSGTIVGTPLSGAAAAIEVTVTDQNGATASKTFILTVVNPAGGIRIVGNLPPGQVGIPYSATLFAVGGIAPYAWSVAGGTLPAWATLDAATGTIYGTPDVSGTIVLTLGVSDSSLPTPATSTSDPLDLRIEDPLEIVETALPTGGPGVPYSTVLSTRGQEGPVQWSVVSGTLTPGLSFDSSAGAFGGAPQGNGMSTFRVQAADSEGRIAQRQFTLSVVPGGGVPPAPIQEGSSGNSCSVASAGAGGGGGGVGFILALGAALLGVLIRIRRVR